MKSTIALQLPLFGMDKYIKNILTKSTAFAPPEPQFGHILLECTEEVQHKPPVQETMYLYQGMERPYDKPFFCAPIHNLKHWLNFKSQ